MGNYFHYYESSQNEGYVIGITISDHSNISKIGITAKGGGYTVTDLEGLTPIPITKEWISEFKLLFYDLASTNTHIENVIGNYTNGRSKFYYVIDTVVNDHGEYIYIDKEILYVHQLQNLYFALTGEELQKT